MPRNIFLTITAFIACSIGSFALLAPGVLIEFAKHAEPSASADVMARTVGILLITIGCLNFLVRNDPDSPTMRSILIANIILQLGIMPIDPHAYWIGVFAEKSAFIPNTILHIVMLLGFIFYLRKMSQRKQTQEKGNCREILSP